MMNAKMWTIVLVAAAACGGGSGPQKGGGSKGSAAMGTGQVAGGKASGNKSMGTQKGESYEGVTCNSSTDGLAWCDSDEEIAFCSDGAWWILDCGVLGAYCGDDGLTVDCYL